MDSRRRAVNPVTLRMESAATTCACGSYLLPVGSGRYAVCAAASEGRCNQSKLVGNPGDWLCLNEALRQLAPRAVRYDRSARRWILADGRRVRLGKRCRRRLGWRDLPRLESVALTPRGVFRRVIAADAKAAADQSGIRKE